MNVIGRVRNNQRRHKKMAFQLGMISFVYLTVWIPLSIIVLGQNYIDPTFLMEYLDTFNFLVYIVPLILPFLCLLSMPDLIQKLKVLLFQRTHTTVVPLNPAVHSPTNLNPQ